MRKFSQFVAFSVIILAYIVLLGWYFDISFILQRAPIGFISSLALFFSGIVLYAVISTGMGANPISDMLLPTSVLVLCLLMSTLITSALLDIHLDISDLFEAVTTQESRVTTKSLSWAEVYSFFMIVLIGINAMSYKSTNHRIQIVLAFFIALPSVLSLVMIAANISSLTVAGITFSAPLTYVIAIFFLIMSFAFGLSAREGMKMTTN